MPQPSFVTVSQKIEIDNVGSISVTDVVPDGNGHFVRELRVFGVVDSANQSTPLVFTLRLSADAAGKVALQTPALTF